MHFGCCGARLTVRAVRFRVHSVPQAASAGKPNRDVSGDPSRIFGHDAGEGIALEKPCEPVLKVGPRLGIEPRFVDEGELPDKGQDRGIGEGGVVEDVFGDLGVEGGEEVGSGCAMFGGVRVGVAGGVFGAVERVFERAVAMGDEGVALRWHVEPIVRVVLGERPAHDVEAFIDCLGLRDEAGDRGAGGGLEEGGRFILEFDFADVDGGLCRVDGETGADGVGTAAEGVEERGHQPVNRMYMMNNPMQNNAMTVMD